MEEYEDSNVNRVRKEIRKAYWRGAALLLAVQVALLLIAAILFPVFATADVYSGPGMGPYRIAEAIDELHRSQGRWATGYEDIRPLIHRYPHRRSFLVSFVRLNSDKDEADYAISVNGILQTYHFSTGASKQQTSDAVPPTELNRKPS